jgi:MFS family permease
MVWALAVTETISYGVLYYAFAAFLVPMQQSLGYGQTILAGAFSLSVLLTGAGAVPAGAWLDRHGARALMTAGSLLAGGCVLLWSRAGGVLTLYLAFAGIGLAGAAVQYEPAFATVNAYFDIQRQNALLTLTMVAGLASTIFGPASALLIRAWAGATPCSSWPPPRPPLPSRTSCYCGARWTKAGNATAPAGSLPPPPRCRPATPPRPRPDHPPGNAPSWPPPCATGRWRS